MRVKKSASNSVSLPVTFKTPIPKGEMSAFSIFGKELNYKLKDTGKSWASSFKVEWSNKIFETRNANFKQGYTGAVNKMFRPMRVIISVLGRNPFLPKTRSGGLASPTYSYNLKTYQWLYFLVTSVFLIFVLVMSSLGFVNFFLDWNLFEKSTNHDAEKTVFKKNLVPFVLFWGCLVHVTVGNISFFTNRKKIVDYLNNWNMVVDIINIELPNSIGRFLIYSNLWIGTFIVLFTVIFFFDFAFIARDSCSLISSLTLWPFTGDGIHNFQNPGGERKLSIFGLFTMLYGIYGSRAILFIYLFKSRLLKHSFKIWNGRLKEQLHSIEEYDRYPERTLCEKLYRDHYILVKMVKQTDSVFGTMLQSYYATQILNMCFELYYLAQSGTFHSEKSDVLVAAVLLAQTVSYFFTVSLHAAYVNEEAMRGFEILRSRGLRVDDSINKKHLIYSLEMSYSQRIVLTGGKFFSVDRPFIVTVLGAVFTYFVIILQFGQNNRIEPPPGESS